MPTTNPQKRKEQKKRRLERQKERDPVAFRAKQRAAEKRQRERQKERDPEAYLKKMRERKMRYKDRYPAKVKDAVKNVPPLSPEQLEIRRERRRAHRAANLELYRKKEKEYRALHPEKNTTKHNNRRAREKSSGGKVSTTIKKTLMKKQKSKCVVCKRDIKNECHLDHIVPLALGGPNIDTNIQLLCPSCNISKSAKHPVDFMQSRGFLI